MELKSYKEQINKVKNLVDKMEQGNLSIVELTDLELLTRSIHERSIILKYKAFGASRASAPSLETSDLETEALEVPKSEAPFDWNPAENDTTTSEEVENDTKEEDPLIELTEEEMKIETPPSIQDILGDISENKEVLQEIVEENIEIDEEAPVNSPSTEDFVSKLKLSDSSTHSFSIGTKIDTLIGAFGLNEKLRFINDLFDGSSESFNEAVKILDAQNDLAEANTQINDLASEHEWDAEEESVTEFVSFVNRRYA
ncbi:MAG: hypothetical protein COA33_004530 [Fluviicola sp.]|nr:hypothetical protein [Fluviicola sp.]PHQ99924.1 MAG: hypothetical protein COB39_00655 [Marinosulfonomonas sp.]